MKQIPLSRGKHALVDDEDFEYLNQWKWHAVKLRGNFYAVRVIYKKCKYHATIMMHRLILDLDDPKIFVDHKDHNGLNNQRNNIRPATHFENASNRLSAKNSTSKYLGVSRKAKSNLWRAKLQANGKSIHIGYFKNEMDAARAYNTRAIIIHGEFANLNIV